MGKKHKRHKHERHCDDTEEDVPEACDEKPQSLKLVLKVGTGDGSSDVFVNSPSEDRHSDKKHKHKKKKKKKDKKRQEERIKSEHEDTEASSIPDDGEDFTGGDFGVSPSKKRAIAMETDEDEPMFKMREPLSRRNSEDLRVLKQSLLHLQKTLQKKDVHSFFAYPVTDIIAPGYSTLIPNPMDFSSMLNKIESMEYRSVMEFKRDFDLMCNNAMTYNRPETIYHKEAKRLLQIGSKSVTKDKLLLMKKTLPFMQDISLTELGFDDDGKEIFLACENPPEENKWEERSTKSPKSTVSSKFEAIPDDLSPEEILAQANDAAKEAKEQLTLRKPNSRFGFLRKRKDGTTSLTFLNSDDTGIVSKTEKVVDLGTLVGKLNSGTGNIAGYKEDRRNKVTPVSYLTYGPFNSYAPSYDSAFANISKEDSSLLLSTYGDETGADYAKSVADFVDGAGDYAIKMVDNLLDTLTKGEHSRTQKFLEIKRKEEEKKSSLKDAEQKTDLTSLANSENQENQPPCPSTFDSSQIDFNSLRSLGELGVDMSFLDHFEKVTEGENSLESNQEKLNQNASLIKDLEHTQNTRFSQKLPMHLSHIPGPTGKEMDIADKVTSGLKDIVKTVTPGDVISTRGVRNAMGITVEPISPDSSPTGDQPMIVDDSHVSGDNVNTELRSFVATEPGEASDSVVNDKMII